LALFRKLVFIGLTGLVGVFNWQYIKPRLANPATISTLRKSAVVELTIGLVVVILTAILVGTSPPDTDDGAAPAAHYIQPSASTRHSLPA
jgi:putative copper export protein